MSNIHSDVARTSQLTSKLDTTLGNLPNSSVLPVINTHADIARASQLTSKLDTTLGNLPSSSVLPVINTHADIARSSEITNKLETDLSNILGSAELADENLSANIPLKNASNTFSGTLQEYTGVTRFADARISGSGTLTFYDSGLHNSFIGTDASGVIVAKTPPSIADKVNKATPTFAGLSDGFAKITSNVLSGGHTIADADLPSTIARDSEVADKVNKATPTFAGLSDGFAKITSNVLSGGHTLAVSDLPASVPTSGEYVPLSGTTCNLPINTNVPVGGSINQSYVDGNGNYATVSYLAANHVAIKTTANVFSGSASTFAAAPIFSSLTAGGLLRINSTSKVLESTSLVAADLPNTVVHTDASSTLLTGELTVCASGTAGASVDFASLTAYGQLFLNRADGAPGIFFQSTGCHIGHSLVNGNARVTTAAADVNIDTGKRYMINGSDLAFSDLAGSATVSQLPAGTLTNTAEVSTSDHIKFTGAGYHYIKGPTTNKIRISDTQVGILNSAGNTVMSYDSTYNNYTIADTQLYVASSALSGTIMHIDAVSATPAVQFSGT